MGSIDIPPFLQEKMKKKVQQNKSADIPPFLQPEKKKDIGNSQLVSQSNGEVSRKPFNPFAIGGEYNQPPKLDTEELDLLNTRHDAAIAEQIKTPLKKIPLTPILDQTAIKKPISEIDVTEALERGKQHKIDMETAIDNTTLKVLKQKGIVAGKGSPYYEAERKKIEEKTKPTMIGGIVINGAEATYHKDKNGNIGLDRNLGFLEGIRKGFNEAVDGEDEANAFAKMDTKQRVEYANKRMEGKQTEYMEERGGVGELLGGAAPYLVKAAAAGTLATVAAITAPETGGASLVGLAPTLTVLLTAPDMIKQGAKDEIMTRYMQLKQERPNIPDEELMSIAEQGGISGGIAGAAEALAFTTSLKLPIFKDSKNVLKTYMKGVASSAVHLGGIMAGTTAAKIAERKLEGYNVDTDKAIDEVTTAFTENATAGAILNGLISGAHTLPKVIKSAFKYSLKDTPSSEIKTALDANVQAGRIPPEVAEKTMADIDGYKAALAKTSDGLKPETQASVAGLIQARDNAIAEMATKDPTQREVYEQKIEAYNKQIEKITKTNDPLKYEIDEVTGNPIDKVAPELPDLTVPIEGTDKKGIPVGEDVPAETNPTDVVGGEKTQPSTVEGKEVGSGGGGDVDLRDNPIVVNMSLPFNEGVNTGLVKNSKGAVYHDRNSAKLEKLGYSKEQIDNLSQTELNEILAKNIENPNVAASVKLPIAEEQTTTQEFLNQASKEGGRFSELATALKKFFGIDGVETTIVKGLKNFFGGKSDGDYANKQIRIDEKAKNKLQTFLHEAIHKVTVDKLLQFERGDYSKLSKQDIDALQNLTRIFNESKIKIHEFLGGGKGDRTKGYYGFTNVHEFVSEAFANPEFQHLLKNLPTEGKNPTIFKQFLDAVAKFLGLKDASILNDIFHHTENLREQSLPTQEESSGKEVDSGVGGDVEDTAKEIEKNPSIISNVSGDEYYHGTSLPKSEDDFTTANKDKGVGVRSNAFMGTSREQKSPFFFITSERGVANDFAQAKKEYHDDKVKPTEKHTSRIIPFKFDEKNSKVLDLTKDNYEFVLQDIGESPIDFFGMGMYEQDQMWEMLDEPKFAEKLKSLGYDAVKFIEPKRGIGIAVLNTDKIVNTTPKGVAEAYHKAKKDGTNPELVKAVEQSLPTQEGAEQPTVLGKEVGSGVGVDVKKVPPVVEQTTTTQSEPVSSIELQNAIKKEQELFGSKETGNIIEDKANRRELQKKRAGIFDVNAKEQLAVDLGLPRTYFDNISFKEWSEMRKWNDKEEYQDKLKELKKKYQSDINSYNEFKKQQNEKSKNGVETKISSTKNGEEDLDKYESSSEDGLDKYSVYSGDYLSKHPDAPNQIPSEIYNDFSDSGLGITKDPKKLDYSKVSKYISKDIFDELSKNIYPTLETTVRKARELLIKEKEQSLPTQEVKAEQPTVTKEGFTEGKDLNNIFSGLKQKYGDKKGSILYDTAIRLINPNKNTIVEIRGNGVVVKEGEKYILKPFGNTDANPKQWTLYKGLDVTDQFAIKEQPTVSETPPALRDVESTAKALDGVDKEKGKNVLKGLINAFTGKDYFYHGTTKEFSKFKKFRKMGVEAIETEQPIFLAQSKDAAEPFSTAKGGRLLRVKVSSDAKLFDPTLIKTNDKPIEYDYSNLTNEAKKLAEAFDNGEIELTLGKLKDKDGYEIINDYIQHGDWDVLESKGVKEWLIKNGYDGVFVREFRNTKDKNLAIFNTDKLIINEPKSISEAYHKAKADDSNPELVKAVESLLSKEQPTPQQPTVSEAKQKVNEEPKVEVPDTKEKAGITNEPSPEIIKPAEEGTGEPPKPPKEPVEEPMGEDGDKKGITHAAVAELRKIIDLPEYEGKPVETHEQLIAEAQKTIKDNPNAANEVMDKMEKGGKITNKDNAIAAVYKATIDAELAKNPSKELLDRARRLSKALDVSGTELGKALESRKLVGQEDTLTNFLLDKEAAQGTALTENQIKTESAKYEELKSAKEALEKQLEAEREQHAKDIAELGVNKAKAKAKKAAKKSDAEYKAERKSIVEDARKALKEIRDNPQASAAPLFRELVAIAPHVKRFMESIANNTADKFDNILTDIHAEFKDILDGLTKRNILDILAGDYDVKPKEQTRSEKANTIRLLKREAELLKQLERERKGEESAKTESAKTQSNRRIDELKEKIKEVRRQNKNRGDDTESPEDATAGEIEYNAKLQKSLIEKAQKLNKEINLINKGNANAKRAEELRNIIKTGKDGKKILTESQVELAKNELKDVENAIKSWELERAEKEVTPFKKSRKTQLLEDKVIDLENKIRHERSKDEYQKRSKGRRIFDKIMEVLGIRRLVQSAIDISVPFRQGATLLSPRKIDVWLKGFGANLQSIFSPKKFERIMHKIRQDQQYHDMQKDGIVFNDLGSADPNLHNEDFRKSFVYKIPVLSEPLKASNRSADAFLNVARYEMYKKMSRVFEMKGLTRESDPKAFKHMANFTMSMTGRGKMNRIFEGENMNNVLGNTFYGARLMASRFNLLNPVTYFDPRVPKVAKIEAMKDMMAFTTTMVAVGTALAYTTGAKVSLNPDDSDFLQLRYGNKVYDISGGLANYVRTGLRLIKAAYTKASGTKYEGREATKKAGESVVNFFRNKLSPNTAYGVDAFFGGRYGQDFDPSDIVEIYPMYAPDVVQSLKEEGLVSLATVLLPNLVGIGFGSYASQGQIDKNLDDLLERNMRSDEMNSEKIHNYKDGGRVITFKEFNEFADKRDEKIKKDIEVLFKQGIGGVPYEKLTQEQVIDETTFIKSNATREVKKEMFGEDKKSRVEKRDDKKLLKERKEKYKNN